MYDAEVANRYEEPWEFAQRCRNMEAIFKACHADRLMRQNKTPNEAMRICGYSRRDIMFSAIKKFRPLYQNAPQPLER